MPSAPCVIGVKATAYGKLDHASLDRRTVTYHQQWWWPVDRVIPATQVCSIEGANFSCVCRRKPRCILPRHWC